LIAVGPGTHHLSLVTETMGGEGFEPPTLSV
jgi:hypothetical protein